MNTIQCLCASSASVVRMDNETHIILMMTLLLYCVLALCNGKPHNMATNGICKFLAGVFKAQSFKIQLGHYTAIIMIECRNRYVMQTKLSGIWLCRYLLLTEFNFGTAIAKLTHFKRVRGAFVCRFWV